MQKEKRMRAYFSLGSVRLVSNRVPKDPKKKEKKVADGILHVHNSHKDPAARFLSAL